MAINKKAKRLKAKIETTPLVYSCDCDFDGSGWRIRTDGMIICDECEKKYRPEMFGLTKMKEIK